MTPDTPDAAFWLTSAFWLALAALVALLLSAFLSAALTALTTASRNKLKALGGLGARGAGAALEVTADRERMIGALLLGKTLATVLAAALATAVLTQAFGTGGVALAVLALTALVLVFADLMPKTLAVAYPEPVALRVAPAARLLVLILAPLARLGRATAGGALSLVGVRPDPDGELLALREEIAGAIVLGHSGGAVEKADRDRLLGALDLSHRTVDEIMRHRRQIEMIDADLPPGEIISRVLASPYTRLPIFRDSDDTILGVVHSKDLLREVDRLIRGDEGSVAGIEALQIEKIAMKPYFVPETTTLDEQMREFLARRTHFALVVDEYGALQGLITLEDILEEIVGDITDEFDVVKKDSGLTPTGDGAWLVDGAMTIRDLNRATDWRLPDDEANTVAGLVIHEAQMIPNEGQVFSFHGFRFEVLGKRENRITRLKLRQL